jgi:hypothetical protein
MSHGTIQTSGSSLSLHSDSDTPTVSEGSPPSVIACIEDGDGSSAIPDWAGRDRWAESYGLRKELDVRLEDWRRLTSMRRSNYPMADSLIGSATA